MRFVQTYRAILFTIAAVCSLTDLSGQNLVPDDVERSVLLALYDSTDASHWNVSPRWTLSRINSFPNPDSTLYGIEVEHGDITSISLNNAGLHGILPTQIDSLRALQYLSMSGNPSLTGTFPNVGDLTELITVNFAGADFSGDFPRSVCDLIKLTSLDLSSNSLTPALRLAGPLPASISQLTKLATLNLNYNDFSMSQAIPDTLSSLDKLTTLYLRSCLLTENSVSTGLSKMNGLSILDLSLNPNFRTSDGVFPNVLQKLPTLSQLYLNSMGIAQLPTGLKKLPSLGYVSLTGNDFSDSTRLSLVLDTLAKCPALKTLELTSCNIKAIPNNIHNLSKLEVLFLSGNPLDPTLCEPLGAMPVLKQLYIYNCNLADLPKSIVNLKTLEMLYANNNRLYPLPTKLDSIPNLKTLYLSSNNIGALPSWFGDGKMASIQNLVLSGNQIPSPLPDSLARLTDLRYLDLSSNRLTGSLPTYFSNFKKLYYLNVSYNTLTNPLPDLSGLISLNYVYLQHNGFSGTLPAFFSNPLVPKVAIDISYNHFDAFSPFTNQASLSLSINDNAFTFSDVLQQVAPIASYVYQHQDSVDVRSTINAAAADSFTMQAGTDTLTSLHCKFQWFKYKNGVSTALTSASSSGERSHTISYVDVADNGASYYYKITNDTRPNLTLISRMRKLTVTVPDFIDVDKTIVGVVGQSLTLTASIGRDASTPQLYQWFKIVNGVSVPVTSAPSSTGYSYTLPAVSQDDDNTQYYYTITSPGAPGIVLKSRPRTIKVVVCKAPPVTSISFSTVPYWCAMSFTPTVAYSGACTTQSYAWDFGDGAASVERNPLHAYGAAGSYSVSLKIDYSCGACKNDTIIRRQVYFDPTLGTMTDTVVQITTDIKTRVISNTASTFSDVWPMTQDNSMLVDQNSFMNGVRGVWRNDASYAYNVSRKMSSTADIANDGVYNLEQFSWSGAEYNLVPNWIKANTMTLYSPFSYDLENKDALGVFAAALYDYGGHLTSANGVNMRNNEMAFTSFEYLNNKATGNWVFGDQLLPATTRFDVYSARQNMAVVKASVAELTNVTRVDVNAFFLKRLKTPGFLINPLLPSRSFIENDNIVCMLPYSLNPDWTVVILRQAPANSIWTGTVVVKNVLTPIVSPVIDSTFAHTGKASIRGNDGKVYTQRFLKPDSAKSYFVSCWVSVRNASPLTPKLADNLGIEIAIKDKNNHPVNTITFEPSGKIIEGWQQIRGAFKCPVNNAIIDLKFKTGSTGNSWYDDLRFHPERGNMRSYVYNLTDYRLRAILDEENFASFFYYDVEGNLYLTKKETEEGVKTITENISYQKENLTGN